MTEEGSTTIPWHRRMEAHVALGVTLLVAITLGAALVATNRLVTNQSLERASTDVEGTRVAFHQLLQTRARSAAALTQLVTALPVFRAHLTDPRLAQESATIWAMADGYRAQLHAEFCVVTDAGGSAIAMPGWPQDRALPGQMRTNIASAAAGHSRADILPTSDGLYLVVSEPAASLRRCLDR